MSATMFAPCATNTPLRRPQVFCRDHGPQPSAYWVCAHIADNHAAVSLRLKATFRLSGVLLCDACANAEVESAAQLRENWSRVRLVCPSCAHGAGLVDSPEVK